MFFKLFLAFEGLPADDILFVARVHNISRERVSSSPYMLQIHYIKYGINTSWCQLDKCSDQQSASIFLLCKLSE